MKAPKGITLDVRPLLDRGEEPLAVIRSTVAALAAGQTLTIVAPFLPAPLIERLKGEGFSAHMERGEDNVWIVVFGRG